MTKVLIATEKPFATEAVEKIKSILTQEGYDVRLLEKYTEKQQLLDAVKDVNAIIIRSDKIDKEVLDVANKELKLVVRAGAGYDNVDCAKASENGVCVMNTPGQNSNAVAELVFGMLVFLNRNRFNGKSGRELKDKKIGIMAFGNVGRNVARVAKGFGMNVLAYDAFLTSDQIESEGVASCNSVKDLFSSCDVLSLHAPATPDTIKSIGYDLVKMMPKNGFIVNTARKEIIDEEGILKALKERDDLCYITDIKPDNDTEMKDALGDRYFSTPKKMGAQTEEANVNAGIAAANQIVAFFRDGVEKFRVNK